MKITRRKLSSVLIFVDLVIVLAGILLKFFLEENLWRNLMAIIAVFSALLALSDLYKKSSDSLRNLSVLSASVIDPLYNKYLASGLFRTSDGSDMTKMSFSGDYDFNQSLRNVTESKERSLMELVWEHRCNRQRLRRSKTDTVIHTVFLVLSVLILVGTLVLLFFFPQYYPHFQQAFLDVLILCCFAFTLAIAFAGSGNFSSLQTMQTVLGLRDRCAEADGKDEAVRPEPAPTPQVVIPVQVAVPAQPVVSTPILPQQPEEQPAAPDESFSVPDPGEKEWKPINEDS